MSATLQSNRIVVVGLLLLVLLTAAVVRGSVVSASGSWQGLGHRAGDAAVVVTARADIRNGPGGKCTWC